MTVPNVLNEKQLEKQVKLLETRLEELRAEISTLEKRKEACLLLLGIQAQTEVAPLDAQPVKAKPVAKAAKKNRLTVEEVPARIRELLQHGEPLTADDLYDRLRDQHGALPSEKPVALVYETLEQLGDDVVETDDGKWTWKNASAPTPQLDA